MEKSSILLGFILVAGICVISAVNQENKKRGIVQENLTDFNFQEKQ